jgi:hypothetical protein
LNLNAILVSNDLDDLNDIPDQTDGILNSSIINSSPNDDISITPTTDIASTPNVESNRSQEPLQPVIYPIDSPPLDTEPVFVEGWFVVIANFLNF